MKFKIGDVVSFRDIDGLSGVAIIVNKEHNLGEVIYYYSNYKKRELGKPHNQGYEYFIKNNRHWFLHGKENGKEKCKKIGVYVDKNLKIPKLKSTIF